MPHDPASSSASGSPARLRALVRQTQACYAELRFEHIARTAITLHSRDLERLETRVDEGGMARVLAPGGGWGSATFSALDQAEGALEQALAAARAIDTDPVELSPVEPVEDERTAVLKEDFRRVPLAEKREVLQLLEDVLLGHAATVQDSRASYRDSFRSVWYATSEGTWIHDERPLVDLYLEAIASSGGEMQSASEGFGRAAGFECMRDQAGLARAAAERAAALLKAEPVPPGTYTVILDPALTGTFIHEAFGHLCEADHLYQNPRLAELVRLGRRVGPETLNVSDFGLPEEAGAMGNIRFDDEGVAKGRTELIREGLLVGRLHSRETAARLGERPTGNARAQDFRFEPLVRMTKTVVERGRTPLAELFAGVELGLYARGARGGETELGRYAFTPEEAFFVRDGQVAERVRDLTLSGNIFDTLARIRFIADDFKLESRGRCGKAGQSMPVSLGGPHLRIDGVVVGGTRE